jgi:hypothetical protein
MLSCLERQATRHATIAGLEATDWADEPTVIVDESSGPDPAERQIANCYRLLQSARSADCEAILFLEDDLLFNAHLKHNIFSWPALQACQRGSHFFASLYNPGIKPKLNTFADEQYEAIPGDVYGSQAIILSKATVDWVVESWPRMTGLIDIRMSRAAAQVTPLLYHRPSLVDHAPVASTLSAMSHRAHDFDAGWKRGTKK